MRIKKLRPFYQIVQFIEENYYNNMSLYIWVISNSEIISHSDTSVQISEDIALDCWNNGRIINVFNELLNFAGEIFRYFFIFNIY